MTKTPAGRHRSNRLSGLDIAVALVVAGVTLALYVATLQPDFGGPEDTPKFQFLGFVLGTAHPPGYPLYVLLSHLFVQLPVGPIAYRANLFSAVMASAACGLTCLIGRQTGAGRIAAACAALALAAGASFWRSAVFAEVYSLASAVVALAVLLVLEWDARGGVCWLLGSVAALSLGLGNHLTIIGAVPAFVSYVLIRDRPAVTVRVVTTAALIVLLGVSQYGFILLRTRQGGEYLESRASTIAELAGVVKADRFADQRFAFSPSVMVTDHLPSLASVIGTELGVAGVLLLVVGCLHAIRTRSGGAGLALGAAAGMLLMIVNLSGDLKGFITPVMVLLWPLVALGCEGVRHWVRAAGAPRRIAGAIAVVASLALPAVNIARNYGDADQSRQTAPARFLRSLFGQLPDHAAMVTEDYWSDMAFTYYRVTGEAGAWRGIVPLPLDAAAVRAATSGPNPRRVFSLGAGAAVLSGDGLWFVRSPLRGPPLAEWLRELPRGAVVVGATAFVPVPFDPSTIDRPEARPIGRPRTFETFAFVAEGPGTAWRGDDVRASLEVDEASLGLRPVIAGSVHATADARGARVEVEGHTVGRVERGLALVVFAPDGTLLRAMEFSEAEPLQVDFQEAVYELRGESPCIEATPHAWTDATAVLASGSAVATLPRLDSTVIEIEVAERGDLLAQSSHLLGDGTTSLEQGQSVGGWRSLDWKLARTSSRRPLFRLSLDRPPERARARLKLGAAGAQRVCSHRPARDLFGGAGREAVLRADFESEAYFGAGWGTAERTPLGTIRRGAGSTSLLVPLRVGHACRVTLEGTATSAVDVTINGSAAGSCDLNQDSRCEIEISAAAARQGLNSIRLTPGVPAAAARPGPALTFRTARFSCGG